ncbi:MAG: hypothetical protein QNL04_04430 [SAR324 cluster bacterium]|nr:hypothetical protein [SAR324 cluster bacterium]
MRIEHGSESFEFSDDKHVLHGDNGKFDLSSFINLKPKASTKGAK